MFTFSLVFPITFNFPRKIARKKYYRMKFVFILNFIAGLALILFLFSGLSIRLKLLLILWKSFMIVSYQISRKWENTYNITSLVPSVFGIILVKHVCFYFNVDLKLLSIILIQTTLLSILLVLILSKYYKQQLKQNHRA